MSINLSGKRIIVSGGTRGIGKAIVTDLVRSGASVSTCSRKADEVYSQLHDELKSAEGDVHVFQADVTSQESVKSFVKNSVESLGGLDVVVNNAGVISHIPVTELGADEWSRVIDSNLTAAFLMVQEAIPRLDSGSSIVNVGSAAALRGIPLRSHYTAAKAGLIGLNRSLAKELGESGIRTNVVAPGVIETEAAADMPEDRKKALKERYKQMTCLGRLGEPSEVADVVAFLASDMSRYITGETLTVDGGM